jgi:hypothetical protein
MSVKPRRDAEDYRREAASLREQAAATTDDVLREGYLRLAERLEELAQTMDPRQ